MALTKEQKKKILANLKEKIVKQKVMIFADFTGLKVKDFASLRKKLKKEGNEIKVAKKTLLSLVLKELKGETLQNFDIQNLRGQVAAVFGYRDEISPAKTVYQFGLTNANLKILGGIFEKNFVEAEKIIELAQLPTKEKLLARLVGSISAPISNFISVLQGNIKGLIYVLAKVKT